MNKSNLHYVLENKATRRSEVIQYIHRVGIAASDQIAKGWFTQHNDPQKRATEWLKTQVNGKVLESYIRGTKSNLYRLTKKTQIELGDTSYLPPFTKRVEHRLYLGNVLLSMMYYHIPPIFITESRQKFNHKDRDYTYAPDIICTWLGDWLTIEAQRTPMVSKLWAKKWEVHRSFWESGAYKKADWQPAKPKKPILVAISKQQPETIRTGCGELYINVVRSVSELKELLDKGALQ